MVNCQVDLNVQANMLDIQTKMRHVNVIGWYPNQYSKNEIQVFLKIFWIIGWSGWPTWIFRPSGQNDWLTSLIDLKIQADKLVKKIYNFLGQLDRNTFIFILFIFLPFFPSSSRWIGQHYF